ncbi:MAG: VWA domain-containing protein [Nitrospiraceae bacterium]
MPADRDFELTWTPSPSAAPSATLFTEQREGHTYALLMLMPPAQTGTSAPRPPRDITFIIDTSGSMAGTSIEQAKASLSSALSRLTTQDRFNVIQFNNVVRSLFTGLEPVTPESMKKAVRYTDHLVADGGTEIVPAVRQALKSVQDTSRLQQIVLLTDGQVGNEDELFELLQQKLGARRFFTVGIGSAPNSHLMHKAAEMGRGSFTYIGNVTEVREKMDGLFRKLERPVLHDVTLDVAGWTNAQVYPSHLADLYEGEPVVLAVRAEAAPAQATIRGEMGSGAWSMPVALREASSKEGLSVYWARKKIAALLAEAFTGSPEEQIRNAVLQVALDHHLVSKYTSLVAVDVTPARPGDHQLQSHPRHKPGPRPGLSSHHGTSGHGHGWPAARPGRSSQPLPGLAAVGCETAPIRLE